MILFARSNHATQHKEASYTLDAAAETARSLVLTNIQGATETLQSLAAYLGYSTQDRIHPQDLAESPRFLSRLETVKDENSFLRLGLTDPDYQCLFVPSNSENNALADRKSDATIQAAMQGTPAVSNTFWDEDLQKYVNLYAVPIYAGGSSESGQVAGVLSASRPTDALRELLTPEFLLNGQVHAHIIDSTGRFVVRNETYFVGDDARSIFETDIIDQESRTELNRAFAANERTQVVLHDTNADYALTVVPLGINDWYVMCVLPENTLVSSLGQWSRWQALTFFIIFVLLVLLTLYLYRTMRQYNRSMQRLAYFDSVTGAYNRAKFMQVLPGRLNSTEKALVVLTIDNASTLKNLYGIDRFNALLCYIKHALDATLTDRDLFCMGRNERFLLLLDAAVPNAVVQHLHPLFHYVRQFRILDHQNFQAIFSAGVRFVTAQESDLERAITEAAMTAETARGLRQDEVLFFDPSIYEPERLRSQIEESMEQALQDGEFQLFLQPKVDPCTGRSLGAEALARWNRPNGTCYRPDQFIPVFEKNGFCVELDFYMVEQACRTLRRWMDEGRPVLPISVNQCRLMLFEENYIQRLEETLARWNIPHELIVLEITESLFFNAVDRIRTVLLDLRERGFSISMDDFGSGFSSLNVLKDLPIDELKLDRGFLRAWDVSSESKRDLIFKHMIHLAQDMHIVTVVEGVETAEEMEFVRDLGCDLIQGYYYDCPLPAADFTSKYLPLPQTETKG